MYGPLGLLQIKIFKLWSPLEAQNKATQIALRISINEYHAVTLFRKHPPEVEGCSCFAYATLVIEKCDPFGHTLNLIIFSPPEHRRLRRAPHARSGVLLE